MTSKIKAEALGMADDMDLRVGDRVTLRISEWSRKTANLFSRVIVGELVMVTPKGLRFRGTVSVEGAEHCHRCALPIRHAASLLIGYGPICCEYLGIDWKGTAEALTPDEVAAIRERIRVAGHTDLIDPAGVWISRSRTAVLELERPEAAPVVVERGHNGRLFDLITAKSGAPLGAPEFGPALAKCLAYIERGFGGAWETLDAPTRELVLQHLADCPPAKSQMTVPAVAKASPVQAWVAGDAILVQSPYSPANVAVSRSIPLGRWEPTYKAWRYPARPDTAKKIAAAWATAGLPVGGDAAFLKLLGEEEAAAVAAVAPVEVEESLEEL
jgi:hypothetical protein